MKEHRAECPLDRFDAGQFLNRGPRGGYPDMPGAQAAFGHSWPGLPYPCDVDAVRDFRESLVIGKADLTEKQVSISTTIPRYKSYAEQVTGDVFGTANAIVASVTVPEGFVAFAARFATKVSAPGWAEAARFRLRTATFDTAGTFTSSADIPGVDEWEGHVDQQTPVMLAGKVPAARSIVIVAALKNRYWTTASGSDKRPLRSKLTAHGTLQVLMLSINSAC